MSSNQSDSLHQKNQQASLEGLNYCDFFDELCKPLFKSLDITFFSYIEAHEDGSLITLGSHETFCAGAIENGIQANIPHYLATVLPRPGYHIIDMQPNYPMNPAVLDYQKAFGWGHDFYVVHIDHENGKKVLKRFLYKSAIENNQSNHTYLNHLPLIHRFQQFMLDKFKDIRKSVSWMQMEEETQTQFIDRLEILKPYDQQPALYRSGPIRLSQREIEVAYWHLQGKRVNEIAEQLDIAYSSVKTYLARLRKKTDSANNHQLSFRLTALGLVEQIKMSF